MNSNKSLKELLLPGRRIGSDVYYEEKATTDRRMMDTLAFWVQQDFTVAQCHRSMDSELEREKREAQERMDAEAFNAMQELRQREGVDPAVKAVESQHEPEGGQNEENEISESDPESSDSSSDSEFPSIVWVPVKAQLSDNELYTQLEEFECRNKILLMNCA